MSIAGGPDIVENGLVLHLDAADLNSYPGSGTLWTDLTGNGNNGTLTNGPTFSSSNRGGIVLDGTNDYVVGGNTSSINNNHSLCIWFKNVGIPSTNDTYGGFLFAQSSTINHGISMQHGWQGQAVHYSTTVNSGIATASGSAPNNVTHYAVATYDGSTQKIYVNNILLTQRNWTTSPNIGTPAMQIGRWGYSGFTRNFNGNIYSVALYNRALSASEVAQNYNATKGRYGL